jgi:hypothetical protein
MTLRHSPFYGLCLIVGAVVFGTAGIGHPLLHGDGAAQLAVIAGTRRWELIHWALLFSLPVMLAGLAGFAWRHRETPGEGPARAGLVLAGFAWCAWMVNILFMAGAAWHLATMYVTAEPGLTATHAVFLYDMLHPFGLAAERVATFALGVTFYLFGWAVWNGRLFHAALAWGAFAVGAACGVTALLSGAAANPLYVVQAAVVVWLASAGVVLLVRR